MDSTDELRRRKPEGSGSAADSPNRKMAGPAENQQDSQSEDRLKVKAQQVAESSDHVRTRDRLNNDKHKELSRKSPKFINWPASFPFVFIFCFAQLN